MYVDWEYYKIFYYVAKYQNFTRAARVLGNNQPNITHAMNRLESQLNCVLFIRSNRGVTLTPEGELLYSRIASAAVQIQDAEEELSASATLEHGAISISTTETALNIYLSEKLRAFHTEYPGIRLRISNHSTPQAVQAVILEEAGRLSRELIPEEDFLRMKKSALGRRIKDLDSFESTCFRLCAYHFESYDYFRFPESFTQISREQLRQFLAENITPRNCAMSVVLPRD